MSTEAMTTITTSARNPHHCARRPIWHWLGRCNRPVALTVIVPGRFGLVQHFVDADARSPDGTCHFTTSPLAYPRIAMPTGARTEIAPESMFASLGKTST